MKEILVKKKQLIWNTTSVLFIWPSLFLLLPKHEGNLKGGTHFDDIDDAKGNTMQLWKWFYRNSSKTDLKDVCRAFQGDYFEGDHSDIQQ